NEYLFMVQARGMRIRENMRNIGAQVLEQVVRSAYSINGTDYPYDFNMSDTAAPPTPYLPAGFTYLPTDICPEKLPTMKGRLEVDMSEIALEEVERNLRQADPTLGLGGHWRPHDCIPRWKVAILVPFRNRHEHLPILFRHLIPSLQRQRLQFGIYVVEQASDEPFNRAMLFNVGFKEAMKDLPWDCVIFHDVDHILENDRNYYGCSEMPRHFAVKLNKYSYMLPYDEFFGGVSGLTSEQFQKINGFPNAFWGWGGEDDDLWNSQTKQRTRRLEILTALRQTTEGFDIMLGYNVSYLRPQMGTRNIVAYATCPFPTTTEEKSSFWGGIRMKSSDPLSDPTLMQVGPGFLLVHNNARPHVARVCRQLLENEGIDTFDWPTGSPDLNAIEHLWDIMFQFIRRHQGVLQSVQELSDALVQIWEYTLLRHSKERQRLDGLSNLRYSPEVSRKGLYTNISVALSRDLAPITDY
ncbi:hypothetical protein NFI96_029808, partial [Prochilodus magdalenae]